MRISCIYIYPQLLFGAINIQSDISTSSYDSHALESYDLQIIKQQHER